MKRQTEREQKLEEENRELRSTIALIQEIATTSPKKRIRVYLPKDLSFSPSARPSR